MNTFEIVMSILGFAVIAGGLAVAFQRTLYIGRQVKLLENQMGLQLKWNRMNSAFIYIGKIMDQQDSSNQALQERFSMLTMKGEKLEEEDIKIIQDDNQVRSHLFKFVTYCEQLALGIELGYFDENVAYESLCYLVTSSCSTLEPYFKLRKEETGLEVADHYRKLAHRWSNQIHKEGSRTITPSFWTRIKSFLRS